MVSASTITTLAVGALALGGLYFLVIKPAQDIGQGISDFVGGIAGIPQGIADWVSTAGSNVPPTSTLWQRSVAPNVNIPSAAPGTIFNPTRIQSVSVSQGQSYYGVQIAGQPAPTAQSAAVAAQSYFMSGGASNSNVRANVASALGISQQYINPNVGRAASASQSNNSSALIRAIAQPAQTRSAATNSAARAASLGITAAQMQPSGVLRR